MERCRMAGASSEAIRARAARKSAGEQDAMTEAVCAPTCRVWW